MNPWLIYWSIFLTFTLSLSAVNNAVAQSFTAKHVQVSGAWDGSKIIAQHFQPEDAEGDFRSIQVVGRVAELNRRRGMLKIGPVQVKWSGLTKFEELSEDSLNIGDILNVRGQVVGTGRLTATTISPSATVTDAEIITLSGTVTRSFEAADNTLNLVVLGLPIAVAPDVHKPGQALTRRLEERWSQDQTKLQVFSKPLIVGGKYETTLRHRQDFDFADDDDITRFDNELSFDLYYPFRSNMALFLELSAAAEFDIYAEDGDEESEKKLKLGEAWLFIDELFASNTGLQIGRQNLSEQREWWWDADLDAIRLFYDQEPWQLEIGIAEQLVRADTEEEFIDPDEDNLMRLFAHLNWSWADDHSLEAYFLRQNDHSSTPRVGDSVSPDQEDNSDADLTWFGLRATGELDLDEAGEINYWLDSAIVRGDEIRLDFDDDSGINIVDNREHFDVRGWGIDLGLSWTTEWPGEPTLTLGYAYGSGDNNEDDSIDRNFRQTGLHGNKGRFAGVNRFNYYGELFDPELSNLKILTAAVGFPLLEDSSVELVYHRYWQVDASDELRDVAIDLDPEGDSKDIGEELDLIFGFEEWEDFEIEIIGSVFKAGDAYGDQSGEKAYSILFNFTYSF